MSLWSASAPGKVLLCGGYLVVESPHVGWTVAVDARFTTAVRAITLRPRAEQQQYLQQQDNHAAAGSSSSQPPSSSQLSTTVTVDSPQFNARFKFVVSWVGDAAHPPVDELSPPSSAAPPQAKATSRSVRVEQIDGRESPFLLFAIAASFANVADPTGLPTTTAAAAAVVRPFDPVLAVADVSLVLRADNDYYSQRGYLESIGQPVTAATLRQVPKHQPLVGDVSKTGLGSSASLTMSLVACLHACFRSLSAGSTATLVATFAHLFTTERLHRVAQIAHCIAQGKIGSGFDVYTAAYGTSVYSRFDAAIIENVMASTTTTTTTMTASNAAATTSMSVAAVCRAADEKLTMWFPAAPRGAAVSGVSASALHVGRRGLPRGVHLLLADIHQGGTSTPGMASKVLAWRKKLLAAPSSNMTASATTSQVITSIPPLAAPNLWDRIAAANEAFIAAAERLTAVAGTQGTARAYDTVLLWLSRVPANEWESLEKALDASDDVRAVIAMFCVLRDAGRLVRLLMRDMGVQAGVEIEPPLLTPLLDGTAGCPGVAAVGCPGAGGYDAIYALVVQPAHDALPSEGPAVAAGSGADTTSGGGPSSSSSVTTTGGAGAPHPHHGGGGGDGTATGAAGGVERYWQSYEALPVCPLLVREGGKGLVVAHTAAGAALLISSAK